LYIARMSSWAKKPVHRILVYTEHGLTPEVVEDFFSACEGDVYDPFVGSGTVGVEALLRGRRFVGADSNPAAVVTAASKISPEMGVRLRPILPRLRKYYDSHIFDVLVSLASSVSTALEAGVFFAVARKFSLLRYAPAPRFGKKPAGNPAEEHARRLRQARRDLRRLAGRRGDLLLVDSTTWMPKKVICVLTSPPFANNVDYARHTALELLWLGVPPSVARNWQLPACEAAARSWKQSLNVDFPIGGKRARGYKRFLGQYLYGMRRHFELLAERLQAEAWYTVGDSMLGGAYIPLHKLLAHFAEEAGLRAVVLALGKRAKPGRTLYLLKLQARR